MSSWCAIFVQSLHRFWFHLHSLRSVYWYVCGCASLPSMPFRTFCVYVAFLRFWLSFSFCKFFICSLFCWIFHHPRSLYWLDTVENTHRIYISSNSKSNKNNQNLKDVTAIEDRTQVKYSFISFARKQFAFGCHGAITFRYIYIHFLQDMQIFTAFWFRNVIQTDFL